MVKQLKKNCNLSILSLALLKIKRSSKHVSGISKQNISFIARKDKKKKSIKIIIRYMHKPNLLYSYSKTAHKLKILLRKYK
jgi:hypothetical protein